MHRCSGWYERATLSATTMMESTAKSWMAGTRPAMRKRRRGCAFLRSSSYGGGSTNPTGKSVVFASWPVQPHLQKYSCSLLTQISSLIRAVLSQEEGRCARHERGAGCGGRESVRRAMAVAGRDEPRERSASVQDDRRFSGRQSRVVLAPVAGVKFAEASRPDRAQTKP